MEGLGYRLTARSCSALDNALLHCRVDERVRELVDALGRKVGLLRSDVYTCLFVQKGLCLSIDTVDVLVAVVQELSDYTRHVVEVENFRGNLAPEDMRQYTSILGRVRERRRAVLDSLHDRSK
ncbi:MAG: hypothetical protein Q4A05_08590 [Ruminococcus sp.]|nr:hypothetical protein [Ruminococcus sp.]